MTDRITAGLMRLYEDQGHRIVFWYDAARDLRTAFDAVDLPDVMVHEIHSQFSVPQVALRVWDVADVYGGQPFARDVSDRNAAGSGKAMVL